MTQASKQDRAWPLAFSGTGTGYCQALMQQRKDMDEIESDLSPMRDLLGRQGGILDLHSDQHGPFLSL